MEREEEEVANQASPLTIENLYRILSLLAKEMSTLRRRRREHHCFVWKRLVIVQIKYQNSARIALVYVLIKIM